MSDGEVQLRDALGDDLSRIHFLNETAVPHVNSVATDFLAGFLEEAATFRVAEIDGRIAGFLVGLTPDADYASPNFLWFRERYERFVYVDRVVVAWSERRRGVARRFYEDLETFSRPRAPRITCEVNVRPSNEGSLRFHQQWGFVQVGSQETEGGAKAVALMVKELGSSVAR